MAGWRYGGILCSTHFTDRLLAWHGGIVRMWNKRKAGGVRDSSAWNILAWFRAHWNTSKCLSRECKKGWDHQTKKLTKNCQLNHELNHFQVRATYRRQVGCKIEPRDCTDITYVHKIIERIKKNQIIINALLKLFTDNVKDTSKSKNRNHDSIKI